MLLAWAYTVGTIFLWIAWDATHGTSLWLIKFSNIDFGVDTRGDKTTFRISFLLWVETNYWLMTWWSIRFIAQFSKQSSIYIGGTFQRKHNMYVVHVLVVSMLTSNNNMRTRLVQFLELAKVTPPFIQSNHEISSGLNLSHFYCLLNQELYVTSIELKNNVSVCLSLCIFYDLV